MAWSIFSRKKELNLSDDFSVKVTCARDNDIKTLAEFNKDEFSQYYENGFLSKVFTDAVFDELKNSKDSKVTLEGVPYTDKFMPGSLHNDMNIEFGITKQTSALGATSYESLAVISADNISDLISSNVLSKSLIKKINSAASDVVRKRDHDRYNAKDGDMLDAVSRTRKLKNIDVTVRKYGETCRKRSLFL